MEPRVTALVVAAGSGSRSGEALPKQYRCVGGKPVLAHAVDALASHPRVGQVRVVIGRGQEEPCRSMLGNRDVGDLVIGGETRRDSVSAGLAAIDGDRVLIHDAARPFLPPAVIDRLLDALDEAPGAVPVLPVADTLALADDGLGPVVPRAGLVRVQTPQAFHLDAIRHAHAVWDVSAEATDDAQMARTAGYRVMTVEGDRSLEKLTYPADFQAADRLLGAGLVSRTGMGFDVHVFAPGDGVWLGGVLVPHSHKLAGHSDADVGLHAITDALLGAIADGDIGSHFPPSDPQWRGADSARFLQHARNLVEARGGRIDHVDLTIICEAPKVGPHRAAIRTRVAGLLGLPEAKISVKATTTEQLGFTGRREGIAAQAVATVRLPELS